jgi:hypothetical protein
MLFTHTNYRHMFYHDQISISYFSYVVTHFIVYVFLRPGNKIRKTLHLSTLIVKYYFFPVATLLGQTSVNINVLQWITCLH